MNRRDLFKFIACAPIVLPAAIKAAAWRRYASGGFISLSAGRSSFIGESGGEAILPLSRIKLIGEKITISLPVVSISPSIEDQMLGHDLFEPEKFSPVAHRVAA